jgi:predicted secreted acid phosphatase
MVRGHDIYYEKMVDGINIIDQCDKSKQYTAIFDIDETIINKNILIEPIYNLYIHAVKNNIRIVFITARDGNKDTIDFTIKQLKHFGLTYDLLYFRPPSMKNVEKFKLFARMNVVENGYEPLFSIGDMHWDVGKFGGIPILIF